MLQLEKCGHSARPEGVTEGDRHQPEADTLHPAGGDEGRPAPIPNESEGLPLSRLDAKAPLTPPHDFCLNWGEYSPPPTPTRSRTIDRKWQRLEALEKLVFRGKVQPYQYNIVLEQLGFTRFLRLASSDVLLAQRRGAR